MNASTRRGRRLQGFIIVAAHQACDGGQYDIALRLLRLVEELVFAESDLKQRQRDLSALVATHERLWHLRHGGAGQPA